MTLINDSFKSLTTKIQKSNKNIELSFKDFLEVVSKNPMLSLRNVFQLMDNMLHHYVQKGINEYPNDPESIDYVEYDCSKLFISGNDSPFFADRLLTNKLFKVFTALKDKTISNRMLLFLGSHGSGKTIFLTNLLKKLEEYTKLDVGIMFETIWKIKTEEDKYLIIPCPSHDHPILQIPKKYRRKFISDIITNETMKRRILSSKEYEWVFKKTPCAICTSIYNALLKTISPEEIFNNIFAKRFEYNKKIGNGITVYNAGDIPRYKSIKNKELQKAIDNFFKNSNLIPYIYSNQTKTNNGVYAIMDAKSYNIQRIIDVHSLISDGVHKVDTIEENIDSLFITLINPENSGVIDEEESFSDRVVEISIPYIRDYLTEIKLYEDTHDKKIHNNFLPEVLNAFSKVIIDSRLNHTSQTINEWILDKEQYVDKKLCDENMHLLKMEAYSGKIPPWLTEVDIKRFDKHIRHKLITEGHEEGFEGISGRESIEMFNDFYSKYNKKNELITIEDVLIFFKDHECEKIDKDILIPIMDSYDYTVLQQIKEAMFFYNNTRINKNIVNYLFAINNELDSIVTCPQTKETFTISVKYLREIEEIFIGNNQYLTDMEEFRNEELKKYVSKTLQEIQQGKKITLTKQFKYLKEKYNYNLKQKVLEPFIDNTNFRRAIDDFNTDAFKNYDKKIRNEVSLLVKNLVCKFGYTEVGAKQVSRHVIDNDLCDKFE